MADTQSPVSDEARGLVRAGQAAMRVGDYEAARTAFERAAALEPHNQAARDGLREAQRRLQQAQRPAAEEQVEYCYRHPNVETALHCTACGRPICARCSTPAAVGQLCPECRRGRRPINYQVAPLDLIKGALVGVVVATLVTALVGFIGAFLGWFLFLLIIAIGPAAAEIIVRSVEWATGNKRGRPIQITVGTAMVLGGVLAYLFAPVNPLAVLLFLLVGVSTAVARLR